MDVHAGAGLNRLDPRADLNHLAGTVVARNQRQPSLIRVANIRPDPAVQAVDRHRGDPNQRLPGGGPRIGKLLQRERLRTTVTAEDDRPHAFLRARHSLLCATSGTTSSATSLRVSGSLSCGRKIAIASMP